MPSATTPSTQGDDAGLQGPDDWHAAPPRDGRPPGERDAGSSAPPTPHAAHRSRSITIAKPALRATAVVFGVLAAAALLVFDGLAALLVQCPKPGDYEDPSALCQSVGGWLDDAEMVLVGFAAFALLAGGIVSARVKDARWILGATGFGIVVTVLIWHLAGEQVGVLR